MNATKLWLQMRRPMLRDDGCEASLREKSNKFEKLARYDGKTLIHSISYSSKDCFRPLIVIKEVRLRGHCASKTGRRWIFCNRAAGSW